jgi:hypothetical protein
MENDGAGMTPTAAPRQANRQAVAAGHSHRPNSVRVRPCAADDIPADPSDDDSHLILLHAEGTKDQAKRRLAIQTQTLQRIEFIYNSMLQSFPPAGNSVRKVAARL